MTSFVPFFPTQGQAPERGFPPITHGILDEPAAAVPGRAGGRDDRLVRGHALAAQHRPVPPHQERRQRWRRRRPAAQQSRFKRGPPPEAARLRHFHQQTRLWCRPPPPAQLLLLKWTRNFQFKVSTKLIQKYSEKKILALIKIKR